MFTDRSKTMIITVPIFIIHKLMELWACAWWACYELYTKHMFTEVMADNRLIFTHFSFKSKYMSDGVVGTKLFMFSMISTTLTDWDTTNYSLRNISKLQKWNLLRYHIIYLYHVSLHILIWLKFWDYIYNKNKLEKSLFSDYLPLTSKSFFLFCGIV